MQQRQQEKLLQFNTFQDIKTTILFSTEENV